MGLFKPDFYRFFAIGFGTGALLVAVTTGISLGGGNAPQGVVSQAVAASAQ